MFAEPPWQDYTKALLTELKYYAEQPQFAGRKIHSIFFGGGTPSLAPASVVADVLEAANTWFAFTDDIEITLEANPGASDAGRFRDYLHAGINRLSIGVQSFDDVELQWLERIHSAGEAEKAYDMARDAGFANINLDLMYALPHQSLDEWFVSLNKAVALCPEHLSCYQLTVEPHTALHVTHEKYKLALPDEGLALQFFWQTRERLAEAGYAAYEISNFAQSDKHCRHNCGYWQYDDYIGIGAGAAGKWDTKDRGVQRYSHLRSPRTYMNKVLASVSAVSHVEHLDRKQAMGEAVWLGLRQRQGVDTVWFEQRFGCTLFEVYAALLARWMNQGKLEQQGRHVRLTAKGLNLADEISASFLC